MKGRVVVQPILVENEVPYLTKESSQNAEICRSVGAVTAPASADRPEWRAVLDWTVLLPPARSR